VLGWVGSALANSSVFLLYFALLVHRQLLGKKAKRVLITMQVAIHVFML
jgi:ABC-type sugar transport system permease subunit